MGSTYSRTIPTDALVVFGVTGDIATPPVLFATVIKGLGATGLADQARVFVKKPFGRDPTCAREFNRIAL